MSRIPLKKIALASLGAIVLSFSPAGASTLEAVKKRGSLACGVSQGLSGFSDRDAQGNWSGFDVDYCRAIAAAILDDPGKVTFTPLSPTERFSALKSGAIDVLARNSTWTIEREATLGILFAAITYHDGQGFMVMNRPEVTSALELDKATVCVQKNTTSQLNAADFFRANSMTYSERPFDTLAEATKALDAGQCNVFTADQSALYAERLRLTKPGSAEVLPDVVSKEPLGLAVRADDIGWFNVVKWVAFALVNAEELGISAAAVPEAKSSARPEVRRFSGAEGGFGKALGLEADWALRAVKAVGHYGEVFERNIGARSRLGIPRGLNQSWANGGILYAPPLR